jgi:hypothetical protein
VRGWIRVVMERATAVAQIVTAVMMSDFDDYTVACSY